jgi:hypothetical protein
VAGAVRPAGAGWVARWEPGCGEGSRGVMY